MGNDFYKKSVIKREEVQENINQINKITSSNLFMDKYNIKLEFQLKDSGVFNKIEKKVIKVSISEHKNGKDTNTKEITIKIGDFYNYFNLLMDLRGKFCREKVSKSFSEIQIDDIDKVGEDDNDICPICEEQKVNMSLPCHHFFCSKCINEWIIKSESCPTCRFKIQKSIRNPTGIQGGQNWDILDQVDQETVDEENEKALNYLTKKIFIR